MDRFFALVMIVLSSVMLYTADALRRRPDAWKYGQPPKHPIYTLAVIIVLDCLCLLLLSASSARFFFPNGT
jgi:hypothetical protein